MISDWFDAKDVQQFGRELAVFFIERIPPDPINRKDVSSAKRLEVLSKMLKKIEVFKLQHKLNVYKKAKFGNAFQWALKDAGYSQEFIRGMTKELLLKF